MIVLYRLLQGICSIGGMFAVVLANGPIAAACCCACAILWILKP